MRPPTRRADVPRAQRRRNAAARAVAAVAVGVLTVTLTACVPSPDPLDAPWAPSGTDHPMAPTGTPLGIAPVPSAGTRTEVLPGLTVTLPESAHEDSAFVPSGPAPSRRFLFGTAGEDLPAFQVTAIRPELGSLRDLSWTDEAFMKADPAISDVHRSVERWPGAAEVIAMTWTQEVTRGDSSTTFDALVLWMRARSGAAFQILAFAEPGQLESSPARAVVLSSDLD